MFGGKIKENYPDRNKNSLKNPIRYYNTLFKLAFNFLFNDQGVDLSNSVECPGRFGRLRKTYRTKTQSEYRPSPTRCGSGTFLILSLYLCCVFV